MDGMAKPFFGRIIIITLRLQKGLTLPSVVFTDDTFHPLMFWLDMVALEQQKYINSHVQRSALQYLKELAGM